MSQHNSILRQLIVCLLLFGQFSCATTIVVQTQQSIEEKQPKAKTVWDLIEHDIVILVTTDGKKRKVIIHSNDWLLRLLVVEIYHNEQPPSGLPEDSLDSLTENEKAGMMAGGWIPPGASIPKVDLVKIPYETIVGFEYVGTKTPKTPITPITTHANVQRQPAPETLEDLKPDDIIIVTTTDGKTRKVLISEVYPVNKFMWVRKGDFAEAFEIRFEEIVEFEYVGTKKKYEPNFNEPNAYVLAIVWGLMAILTLLIVCEILGEERCAEELFPPTQ